MTGGMRSCSISRFPFPSKSPSPPFKPTPRSPISILGFPFPSRSPSPPSKPTPGSPISIPSYHPQSCCRSPRWTPIFSATPRGPRGFGTTARKEEETRRREDPKEKGGKPMPVMERNGGGGDGFGDSDRPEEEDGTIPEAVTERMMRRMVASVGIPVVLGVMMLPVFYYVKKGLKVDVPTWVPFMASFVSLGAALLGVSYGIVSSSWDPLREGSLLGWTEARKNWPVFWRSLRGRSRETN